MGKREKAVNQKFLEARGGIEPPIMVLQTIALPLGDRATDEELRGEDGTEVFALSSCSVLHQQTPSALQKALPIKTFSRDEAQHAAPLQTYTACRSLRV
jgi:hypothetical protein